MALPYSQKSATPLWESNWASGGTISWAYVVFGIDSTPHESTELAARVPLCVASSSTRMCSFIGVSYRDTHVEFHLDLFTELLIRADKAKGPDEYSCQCLALGLDIAGTGSQAKA